MLRVPSRRYRHLAATLTILGICFCFAGSNDVGSASQAEKSKDPAKRQILAISGDGLEETDGSPLLMKYFLGMTGKTKPRICFMPSASGDAKEDITRWNRVMKELDCVPRLQKIYIESPKIKSFEDELLQADAIYVGSGNAVNMLAMWKVQGVDKILRRAYDRGIILGGEGAGAIGWFEQGLTDSRPGKLTPLDCLGFLPGSFCADADPKNDRKALFSTWITKGDIKPGIAADRGTAIHYVDEKLHKVVTNKANVQAYQINREGGKVVEAVLKAETVGK